MSSPTLRSFRTAIVFSSVLPLLGCPGDDGGTDTDAADSTSTTAPATTSTDPTTDPDSTTAAPNDTTSTTDAPTTSATGTDTGSGTDSGTDSGSESGSSTGDMEICEVMLPPPPKCGAANMPGPAYLPANWPGTAASPTALEVNAQQAGGVGFIKDPDTPIGEECDIFAQDCPAGEKCMPWSNDGSGSWNATRCSPIAAAPNQIGDTCTVEGSGTSGIDDCDIGTMCWDVNPETNEGTCVEMCSCTEITPVCNTANTTCAISNDGVLALCLPVCNPVDPEACEEGLGCYPVSDTFLCAPDVSGEMGEAGDPCSFINACSAGLFCLGADVVPDCDGGSPGCCSAACSIGDDAACLPGQTCTAWYNPGDAPDECLGMAGVCVL